MVARIRRPTPSPTMECNLVSEWQHKKRLHVSLPFHDHKKVKTEKKHERKALIIYHCCRLSRPPFANKVFMTNEDDSELFSCAFKANRYHNGATHANIWSGILIFQLRHLPHLSSSSAFKGERNCSTEGREAKRAKAHQQTHHLHRISSDDALDFSVTQEKVRREFCFCSRCVHLSSNSSRALPPSLLPSRCPFWWNDSLFVVASAWRNGKRRDDDVESFLNFWLNVISRNPYFAKMKPDETVSIQL